MKRARDRDQVTENTECLEPDESCAEQSMSDENQLQDISELCSSTL